MGKQLRWGRVYATHWSQNKLSDQDLSYIVVCLYKSIKQPCISDLSRRLHWWIDISINIEVKAYQKKSKDQIS